MGREVRKVPASWQHPTSPKGGFIPLETDDMPQWTEAEATHFQMYENVTEGTPISPVMDSPEALAHWLADTKASAFADHPASYEAWLKVCRGSVAHAATISKGEIVSGVEAEDDEAEEAIFQQLRRESKLLGVCLIPPKQNED
jgi:hypothetical protein